MIALFVAEGINTPVNLGNPQPITMIELAREIIELTNSNSKIIYMELPSDDPTQREPNIAKAENLLNWLPLISRKSGLQKTIQYFQQTVDKTEK